ncbi:MAG TPA: energy transducer TonB [Candidatus Eisenbacteria bacterium]|nr:energy transducer TonB [Candidatus Eisenbacteria bacterium]
MTRAWLAVAGMLVASVAGAGNTAFEGAWRIQDRDATVTVSFLTDRICHVERSDGFESVGFYDRGHYRGLLRKSDAPAVAGEEQATLDSTGAWHVVDTFRDGAIGRTEQMTWVRERQPADGPAYGDYVYVDELPEAILKVPPQYPQAARADGIQGTVIVQALVGRDGHVQDTRIAHSIPGLDEAALTCVRKWEFKPARSKGQPISVWVTIPVKFTLH